MKRLATVSLSLLSLVSVAAFAAGSTMNGYISDAMCGAKHAGTNPDCAKKCLAGGEKPVFVDEAKSRFGRSTIPIPSRMPGASMWL